MSNPADRLAGALAERYRIERHLGGGGMGPIISILVGGLNLAPIAMIAIIPLWLGITYATARTAYHRSAKRRVRELEGLADRLAALARELIPVRAAVRGSAPLS